MTGRGLVRAGLVGSGLVGSGLVRVGFAVAVLAPCLLVTGCPGSLENPEDFEEGSTGTQPLVDPCNGLITKKCALANCHDAESTSVDLTLQGREERTVDKAAATCPGKYIDTANPEASLMYTKCAEAQPACGSPMPLARESLSADELSCMLGYLQSLGGGSTGATGSSASSGSTSSAASGAASSGPGGGAE